MAQTDFINISPSEINSFRNTVKDVYELGETPNVPELPNNANLNQTISVTTNQIKNTFSASLGFGGVNISADVEHEYHAYDIVKSVVVQGSIEGPIMSATYGVGCRLILKIKKTDLEVNIDLSQLAAQTELGLVNTSIALELKGFGAGSLPNIPSDVFTFSKFDLDKFTKVNNLINSVLTFLTNPANESSYDPILLGVDLKKLYTDDIEDILKFGNYALWRIKKGTPLKEAISIANENGVKLDEEIVRRVYALMLERPQLALENSQDLPIGSNEPNNDESGRARELLVKYRRVTKKDADNNQ
ncbi:hypothetical protein BKI52_30445 [marine bacterium AO1-C]|nr:hypothetical protein BKI52_30445 [marine bacterium AO1-C]